LPSKLAETGRRAGTSAADVTAMAFFHELDAWTEYWDIYHPETRGRYYFGESDESGLLSLLVPRVTTPAIFAAWKNRALGIDIEQEFEKCAVGADVAAAVSEYDGLVAGIFERHFGDAGDDCSRRAYLRAVHRFSTDTLPPATERLARVPPGDRRWRTAGRHTIDADMMWFVWALQLEAAEAAAGAPSAAAGVRSSASNAGGLRALLLSGVATGCSANFAWRGHRRTRPEYRADSATEALLLERGLHWATDFSAAAAEVHQLYRIREWGTSPARS
jgi:hypothetical protein